MLICFSEFENHLQIPRGTFLKAIKYQGHDGAWGKLEKGEISFDEFGKQLTQDVSREVRFSVHQKLA